MISRRTFLSAGPLALAACGRVEGAYFGRTAWRQQQRLVYLIGAEPATLDPAKSADLFELYIVHALFEGLTTLHPLSGTPMAGLATHYEASPDGLQYIFYLRGHADARGVRLANTSDLPREFSRGCFAPSPTEPARWSDGAEITAHDFVYSWRRAVDPATAANFAYLLFCIENAEDITARKRKPNELAVHALNDFKLQVDLRAPTPFFLQLISSRIFCAVPRRSIEASEPSWTEPGRLVSSGAFKLADRRRKRAHCPHQRILTITKPSLVTLTELIFLTVIDGSANVNLYKCGDAALIQTYIPSLMPTLSRKKDFQSYAACGTIFQVLNTTRPPLNDVRVRYALNMGTDKRAVADFMGVGRNPARRLVPPLTGYRAPAGLPVTIDGVSCDVLDFNPLSGARASHESVWHATASDRGTEAQFARGQAVRAALQEAVAGNARDRAGRLSLRNCRPGFRVFSARLTRVSLRSAIMPIIWIRCGSLISYRSHSAANGTAGPIRSMTRCLPLPRSSDARRGWRSSARCESYLLRAMPIVPLYRMSGFICACRLFEALV